MPQIGIEQGTRLDGCASDALDRIPFGSGPNRGLGRAAPGGDGYDACMLGLVLEAKGEAAEGARAARALALPRRGSLEAPVAAHGVAGAIAATSLLATNAAWIQWGQGRNPEPFHFHSEAGS